jgi:tetratricopeptide (TPR) repeat protein
VQRAVDALAPLEVTPLRARVINALVCYFLYLRKLVWPSHLAVLYPEVNHWPLAQISLAAAVLGGLSLLVFRQRRERPWLLTGWAWFLGMLVPVIGLVKVGSHLIADRYTYLPAIGLFIILAWGAAEFAGSSVRRRALVGTAMVLFWRNTQTLFRRALAVTTSNYVAYTSLAFDFAEHKKPDQAEQCLRASLEINPAFEPAWTKLATVLVEQGRVDEAIDDCHQALRLDPRSVAAHSILGLALLQRGQTNEAIMHYSEALRYRPDFADAHYNLANVLAHQGDFEKAAEHYRAALRSEPDSADAHNNLAYMLVREGARGTVWEMR